MRGHWRRHSVRATRERWGWHRRARGSEAWRPAAPACTAKRGTGSATLLPGFCVCTYVCYGDVLLQRSERARGLDSTESTQLLHQIVLGHKFQRVHVAVVRRHVKVERHRALLLRRTHRMREFGGVYFAPKHHAIVRLGGFLFVVEASERRGLRRERANVSLVRYRVVAANLALSGRARVVAHRTLPFLLNCASQRPVGNV